MLQMDGNIVTIVTITSIVPWKSSPVANKKERIVAFSESISNIPVVY